MSLVKNTHKKDSNDKTPLWVKVAKWVVVPIIVALIAMISNIFGGSSSVNQADTISTVGNGNNIYSKSNINYNQAPLVVEQDEKAWKDANAVLSKFIRSTNIGDFEALRTVFSNRYQNIDDKIEEAKQHTEEISGGYEVSNPERVEGESSSDIKVFKFNREYYLANDNKKKHGETLKAYILNDDGEWKIDRFAVVFNEYH